MSFVRRIPAFQGRPSSGGIASNKGSFSTGILPASAIRFWAAHAAAVLALTFPKLGLSEVTITNHSLRFYNDCINWASMVNTITQDGNKIRFTCNDVVAAAWWKHLSKDGEYDVKNNSGMWTIRRFSASGYCGHRIEDASGNGPAQEDAENNVMKNFICVIEQDAPK